MNFWDITTIIRNQVAAIQATANKFLDFSIGSVLLAMVESNSLVATWLMSLIVNVLATTRAATSSGTDLDSWMGDFGLTREPAIAATGYVTFSRFTAGQQAVVPVNGAVAVETNDSSQQFIVTIDTGNANYNANLGGYVMVAGVSSIVVPVVATTAGTAGNVMIGAIAVLVQSIPGVDTVTNAAAFVNGIDAESDDNFRARFITYIGSLAKATKSAIEYAVASTRAGLTYTVTENQTYAGVADNGYFFVVVDDGTGAPSSTLLSSINNAIDVVRPLTSRFGVFAPVVVTANVIMVVTVGSGYDSTATKSAVSAAVVNYINALSLGDTLPYTRLAQVAYDTSPGVVNVSGVAVNGGSGDLTATPLQIIKVGTITIN